MSGVRHIEVAVDEADQRLDRWFKRRFPNLGHGRLERLLRRGEIRLDGARAKSADRVRKGQIIRVPPLGEPAAGGAAAVRPAAPVSDRDAVLVRDSVLYKDGAVIVLNKPPGLAVQGGSGQTRHLDGLLSALQGDAPEAPRLTHRLDKNTSGVLVLGRTRRSAAALARAFHSKAARKIYWAAVVGAPKPRAGAIRYGLVKGAAGAGDKMLCLAPDAVRRIEGAKAALTEFVTLETLGDRVAWTALRPVTGRTHQLRAHMAELGYPILGDGKYGARAGDPFGPQRSAFIGGEISRKLHLHARRLSFPHPETGDLLTVSAPLPEHMARSWAMFGWSETNLAAGGLDDDPFDD